VRVTNVRPQAPPSEDERLFAEEGSSGGCASGECLPDVEPEPEPAPPAPSPAPRVPSGRDNLRSTLADRWRAAVDTVRAAIGQQYARHVRALAFGRLLWIREGEVGLAYAPKDGLHKDTVSGNGRALIEKALSEHFGRPTKLVLQDGAAGDESSPEGLVSIAEQEAQERADYEKSTEGRVRAHPAVRATLKFLGGEIEHIQVYDQPVRPSATPANETPDESP